MNYKETGFRAFYHHFCVLPITKHTKNSLRDFPGAENANGILTYGYYDREAGLTLEVLAAAHIKNDAARFEDTLETIRSFIRISAVADDDFLFFSDEDCSLANRYAKKIEMLHHYDANEEVEKTREMTFLDECRHEKCIDDIMVYLMKEGLNHEGCWVNIIGLGDGYFMGTLLNEPNQNFGFHEGDKTAFCILETEDKKIICYSDLNPTAKRTIDDLEDGSMLEAVVSKFNKERNRINLLNVLEILRDSYVWVPCTAKLGEEDQIRIEALVKGMKDNLDGLKGQDFVTNKETSMVPDILQNGNSFFFPIFSTKDAMGDYGNHFSKLQMHVLEAINLARNNDKQPEGIVLNAFSESFVLDKKLWDLVGNMESFI